MANGSARELVKRLASTTTDSERSILRQVRAEGLHISDRAARAIVHRVRPHRIGARRLTTAQYTQIAVTASRPSVKVAEARDPVKAIQNELESLKNPIRATRRAIIELGQMQRSTAAGDYDYRQAPVEVPRPTRTGAPLSRALGVTRLSNGDYAWVQKAFPVSRPDKITVENQATAGYTHGEIFGPRATGQGLSADAQRSAGSRIQARPRIFQNDPDGAIGVAPWPGTT